jgi:hypothetical protein
MLFPILNYPFFLREWISYVSFLGKARRFLIPHEILKPALGPLGGLVDCSFAPSFTYFHSLTCSLVHAFIHFLTRSFIPSLLITH